MRLNQHSCFTMSPEAIGEAIQLVIDAIQAAFGVKRLTDKVEPTASNDHCCDATLLRKLLACDNGLGRVASLPKNSSFIRRAA